MGFPAVLTLVVVVLMLVGLILELLAPDVIVFSALGLLLLADVISVKDALAGFANSGMLTVAFLHRRLCGPVLGTARIFRRPDHGQLRRRSKNAW